MLDCFSLSFCLFKQIMSQPCLIVPIVCVFVVSVGHLGGQCGPPWWSVWATLVVSVGHLGGQCGPPWWSVWVTLVVSVGHLGGQGEQQTRRQNSHLSWPCLTTDWPCLTTDWPCPTTDWPCLTTDWPCLTTDWPCPTTDWPCLPLTGHVYH